MRAINPTAFWLILALTTLLTVDLRADDDEAAMARLQAVQGKWTRRQMTPQGPVTLVKEHRGNKTILTARNDDGAVLYSHESDFRVEVSGKLSILTFFNRTITAGPNTGQVVIQPVSFVYRADANRFVEAYGLLEGENQTPLMIVWDRVGP